MRKFMDRQKVEKVSGYRYPGIILGLLEKTNGLEIYAVEADHPDFAGMVHIFNETQLVERWHKQPSPPPKDIIKGDLWERIINGDRCAILSISVDELSLRWLVTYQHMQSDAYLWTRDYNIFKSRFRKIK